MAARADEKHLRVERLVVNVYRRMADPGARWFSKRRLIKSTSELRRREVDRIPARRPGI